MLWRWLLIREQANSFGRSEEICGELFQGLNRDDYVIQTKW